MLKIEEIGYNPTITIFPNLKNPNNGESVALLEALNRIKNGNSKSLVNHIRDGNPEEKLMLPCICFSGEFTNRNAKGLINHSGLMVLDFDKMKPNEIAISNLTLQQNKHIVSTFISPTGNGIKAIVRVPNT